MLLMEAAATAVGFCIETGKIWKFVGQILLIFKIVIPILLIIFGMIDLGKAVVGSKDEDVKKAISHLAFRAVAAVVIFFIPTLISFIFKLVDGFEPGEFENCANCITTPNSNCQVKN